MTQHLTVLGCRRFATENFKGLFYRTNYMLQSTRLLRTRRRSPSSKTSTLSTTETDAGSPERPPPTDMPLAYVQGEITDVEKYRTEGSVWSNETLRGAWNTMNNLFQDGILCSDAIRRKKMVERDLVGLALCTSCAEVKHLLALLSPSMRSFILSQPSYRHTEVEEFFVHIGQNVEVRGGNWVIQASPPSVKDLHYTLRRVGQFGDDGRGCIKDTPHRVAVWRSRLGEPLGVTIRVGRYVPNVAQALVPLARRGSVLIISKAGMGKTTLLRDLAATLSRDTAKPRVMVVDTSNEIGGDSPIPLPFLGRCRRIQVARRGEQEEVMHQILQNHSPEYVVVDEVASMAEAEAAWSISQRGVRLVATCHGEGLSGLLQNQSLNMLVGGAAQAFLSNEERRLRNKVKKTILERPHSSPFRFVVELHSRKFAHLYVNVNQAVDALLDEQNARQNARIGRRIAVDEPLPDEVMSLIFSHDVDDSVPRESQQALRICSDDEGFMLPERENERISEGFDGRRRSCSYGNGKRSNEELMNELNNFF